MLPRYIGIFEPADLDLLQRVFDQLCRERRLRKKTGNSGKPLPRKSSSFSRTE
ncbi:RNA-binding protein [Mesorhizobium sp. M7A.F.Ca.US.001.01.1.1]|nr:RNA-binding protein [Mesorhizobium sp. M7A.F.Ca.US.001.01.1.1]